jgi:transcription-repair coupling factor (superfamily II helicase)
MPIPLDILRSTPQVARLAQDLGAGRRVVARGSAGSATHLLAGAIAAETKRPVLLVAAHLDECDEAVDELASMGLDADRFPALEALPGESTAALDLFAERLRTVRRAASGALPGVLVAPIQALMQGVPPVESLGSLSRDISKGQTVSLSGLVRWLESAGYSRRDAVEEPGEFAVRGGIMDVFPPGIGGLVETKPTPVRLDFFGDEIDKLTEIDLNTMGSDRVIDRIELLAADPALIQSDRGVLFPTLLPPGVLVVLNELAEIVEQARGYYERVTDARGIFGPPAVLAALQKHAHAFAEINRFSAGSASADATLELPLVNVPPFSKDLTEAMKELAGLAREGRVLVCCQNEGERQRFGELAAEHLADAASSTDSVVAYVHEGFIWSGEIPVAVLPYHELVNRFTVRRRGGKISAGRAMDTFLDLSVGDFVVHADHGIAQLVGLTMLAPRDLPGANKPTLPTQALKRPASKSSPKDPDEQEYLVLEFAGASKLYVPAVQIDLVQKYVGGFKGKPPLSTLGGARWQHQKERVEESVRDLAGELLRVRAAREHIPGVAFPQDTAWQREFEEEFPYEETEDQIAGLAAIKADMHNPRPMDRLICGDVGFGKTELAIRAAFKAAEFGKQVAVLVPTTVLAEQHERTFRSRFAGYPFRIESISRFKEGKEIRDILDSCRKGQVDVLIGTHRVLSEDVKFADLGLVVVDEEQRFGVEHKERLLRLRLTADVLTLSATPIPRTLHMALLGIRDISNLTTPPVDRRAIVTEVLPYNERRIKQAIERELAREGQVFFVHNRVHNIEEVADRVQALVPSASVIFGHGQMDGDDLEAVMLKFIRGDADILVSTTIIESGIDIPSANTMIICDADRFGLSELHQLRGRVGRSKHRAYCYLMLPEERTLTDQGKKRLQAIEQYSMLGAGFKIAMRDLEIRGAGNILGPEQSGHIAAVGYEMYCQLLEGAVHELKNEPPPPKPSATSVEIGVVGTIPRTYIPSDQRRLEAYRRIATAASKADLDKVKADLVAAYGDPPKPTVRLFLVAELRTAAAALGVRSVTLRGNDVVLLVKDAKPVAEKLAAVPAGQTKAIQARVSVLPSQTSDTLAEVYFRPPENYLEPETLLGVLRKRLM